MSRLVNELIKRQKKNYMQNPFITSLFGADPAAHVWKDGRLYVYASRDIDKSGSNLTMDYMDHYHVFSTTDMVNWVDEGEIFSSEQVDWGIDGFMWAPDAAYKNGKYYFYYPHPSSAPWNDNWKVGVAVSKHPASNFEDIGTIEGLGGHALIDPSVFIDEDGQAYIYYGGGAHAYQGKMNEDMVSLAKPMQTVEGLRDFHEAAWIFKRQGIYYFTYSDNHSGANHMCYATSTTPLGPWKYQGYYMLPVGCETTHGSVVEYKGEWYAFYHNNAVSNLNELRSICCDHLQFNKDGTIQMVIQTRNGTLPLEENGFEKPLNFQQYSVKDNNNLIDLKLTKEKRSPFQNIVTGFDHFGSSICFRKVNGFENGRVALGIYYGTAANLSKLRLTVNGKDWSLVNCPYTGSGHTFDGYSTITIQIKPGENNTVILTGGAGELSLEGISVAQVKER
ncbi:Endo-1,4-beta-xylanase A precursor [Pediococcus damnosus]|uniref:Endo-1,4-beta-xylanase A n=1 Tax=Pediococcus damnosus TaxID=51663 RepID=A0A0R2HR57_9LACO|nr:family 43 glycosylhydrolase [Pediococcus damnosus]AMV62184.1 Endo-1,4-beta-xylanase A precursor [Pediococcus damnosus]AMV67959.1 Endo-1,4-beta-xylanase A precursor [Pediococcus damnosus]KRN52503.1 hypothetical protein IV84_GL000615 [Pediococcus damnosus]PIO84616.1 hypothetical protein BSQ37_01050 [Pediococcus damnosus]PJE48644.1 hypothetical protein BSQ36_01045 [Pediococcus damnosus]